MADIAQLRRDCNYYKYGTQCRKATHIYTNAVLSIPLVRCTLRTLCENKGLLGYHPVTAQSGPSGRAVGSGSAVAVYPIPEKIVKSLAKERRRELAVDPLSLYMIVSITKETDSS
jgi:hypothetical protein